MSLDTMRDLLIDELSDLHSAERQLVQALPKLVKAASAPKLKQAFTAHLAETKTQVERLNQAFTAMGEKPKRKKCKGMEGLIEEGSEKAQEDGDDAVRDAGLIGAAQRVEHYEIAAYGTVIAFAESIGESQVVTILRKTLDEEEAADAKLSGIAEGGLNAEAAGAGEEEEEEE